MVANTGPDAIQWWKYPAVTTDQINANLTANNAILVSLAPADTTGSTFDVVMNQSPNPSIGWGWYRNLTMSEFTGVLSQNQGAAVDFESYLMNGQENFLDDHGAEHLVDDAAAICGLRRHGGGRLAGRPARDRRRDPATMAAYDCEFAKLMQQDPNNKVPGASVAVTQNGRLVLARSYGLSDQQELRIMHSRQPSARREHLEDDHGGGSVPKLTEKSEKTPPS